MRVLRAIGIVGLYLFIVAVFGLALAGWAHASTVYVQTDTPVIYGSGSHNGELVVQLVFSGCDADVDGDAVLADCAFANLSVITPLTYSGEQVSLVAVSPHLHVGMPDCFVLRRTGKEIHMRCVTTP